MKQLKTFEFAQPVGKATYDWDKLLNGGIYQLEQGKDFQCKPDTILMMARNQAKKRGKKVRGAKVEGGVVLQAYETNGE